MPASVEEGCAGGDVAPLSRCCIARWPAIHGSLSSNSNEKSTSLITTVEYGGVTTGYGESEATIVASPGYTATEILAIAAAWLGAKSQRLAVAGGMGHT